MNSFDVANWFICNIDREAGDSITHLKLQKLVYYAEAWNLALNKESLFGEDFEAWAHGPVIPGLYHVYKEYGFEALPMCDCEDNIDSETEKILLEVKRVYGELSAKKLETLTHSEKPWQEARNGIPPEASCTNIISKTTMEEFYSEKLNG